jgi:predicted MFS family arabinose efflux permease
MLSTTVILPAFGGWRQVLVFYGVISIVFGLLWLMIHPAEVAHNPSDGERHSLWQNLRYVMGLRNMWILGLSGLGIMACFQGFTG